MELSKSLQASTATIPIERVSVGHASDLEAATGCTVILVPEGARASVDIRGGAPGTLETALLSPYSSVEELHAVLLTGGSASGLYAASGVTRWLREHGFGYKTQFARIPLVAGAVIYDLGIGRADVFPSAEMAYEACVSASRTFSLGSVGAGTGATVGKVAGPAHMMKGGLGYAEVVLAEEITVCAITVVNALGDVVARDGSIIAGARRDTQFIDSEATLLALERMPSFRDIESTTLSVVLTDARLTKTECAVVARLSHDGFARAIRPVHTPVDGDCVFVLSAGVKHASAFQVGVAAAKAVEESIRCAVTKATGLLGVRAARDLGL